MPLFGAMARENAGHNAGHSLSGNLEVDDMEFRHAAELAA
jgi:hypothetical protein